jgi:hypothetical protein
MDRLKCKACGCYSLMPIDLEPDEEEAEAISLGEDQESRFFSCHVCGDNWLSLKETESDGGCTVTFVHQMGIQPTLKRVAYLDTPVLMAEATIGRWDYFAGDEAVEESDWRAQLARRRDLLRAVCTN